MKERTAARLAWSLWVLAMTAVGVALYLHRQRPAAGGAISEDLIFVAIFAAIGAVGAMVASRQPRNATGWLFLAAAVAAGALFLSDEYSVFASASHPALPGAVWTAWASEWMWIALLGILGLYLPLLFPDGRLPSPRWRPFAWIAGAFFTFVCTVFALEPGPIGALRYPNPIGVEALRGLVRFLDGPGYGIFLVLALIAASSLVVRFRRAGGQERQQIKWFAFAVAIFAVQFVVDGIVQALGIQRGVFLNTVLPAIAFLALPVGAGIAILKYRLYDIDVVISRTVLYAALAVFITAVYVGIVVGIGALVGSRGNLFLSILATAVIAVLFQPIRLRARHLANRLVFGKRAEPYELLSEFAGRLGGSYSIEDVLPRIARVVGEGTGAARSRVWLRLEDQLRPAAGWPDAFEPVGAVLLKGDDLPELPDDERAFAVRHQGELLGALSVATRPGESLTPAQEKLLEDLAAQAGLILRNVRLVQELRASRQRIVSAQDEGRRRLERNIHDGAQQQLVALAVKLRLVETFAAKDPERAARLAAEAKAETQDALENLRDLARGIYPPLLADQGLAAAVEAQARKMSVPVRVDRNGVGRYPAEIEAGVYFCILEALQNVAKYADASRVEIRLDSINGDLQFSVADDGKGFDPLTAAGGTGLTNMRDRVEALGGSLEVRSAPAEGTVVTGSIPLGESGL